MHPNISESAFGGMPLLLLLLLLPLPLLLLLLCSLIEDEQRVLDERLDESRSPLMPLLSTGCGPLISFLVLCFAQEFIQQMFKFLKTN